MWKLGMSWLERWGRRQVEGEGKHVAEVGNGHSKGRQQPWQVRLGDKRTAQ